MPDLARLPQAVRAAWYRTSLGEVLRVLALPSPDERIEPALAAFRQRWVVPGADDDPVFVLGSAWRSGSTLLQRLVVSSGSIHLWGEPWARSDPFRRLAESLG